MAREKEEHQRGSFAGSGQIGQQRASPSIFTLPGTNMEVENHLFVVENGLPRGHSPLPC